MFLSIYIRNNYYRPIQLFEDSSEKGVLFPNMRARFDTNVGKMWSGYTSDDSLMFREKMDYFWMDRNDTSYSTPFYDCTLPKEVRKSLPPNTDGTFFMSTYSRAHLYFWNGTCEQYVDTLYSHRKQHILAIQGHAFRLRDESNSTILSQRVLKDFVIDGKNYDKYLQLQTEEIEFERENLRQQLMAQISKLNVYQDLFKLSRNETNKNESKVTYQGGLLNIATKEKTASCLPSYSIKSFM